MTTPGIDTMQMAREELATQMFPSPDDMFDDLSPVAALFYVEQCAVELLKQYVAQLSEDDVDIADTSEGAGKALVAISKALGMLDTACIAMGIIPDDVDPTS